MELKSIILECGDIERLASFYGQLLNWPIVWREEDFVILKSPNCGVGLALQYADDYVAPVWPSEPGRQQLMAHLDFGVSDSDEMEKYATRAVELGGRIAAAQYGRGEWITVLDPAGHPFCIVIWP